MNRSDDSHNAGSGSSRRAFLGATGTLSAAMAALPSIGGAVQAQPAAAEAAQPLPQIKLGKYSVSRLICGSNPFLGLSHLSAMINFEMRQYYTRQQITETLKTCQKAGINCWAAGNFGSKDVSIANPTIQFTVNTNGDNAVKNVPEFVKLGLIGLTHHGGPTDSAFKSGKLDTVREWTKKVRDSGVAVGVCSHIPRVFETIESEGWDVDYFMCCVYQWGRRKAELEQVFNADNMPVEGTITDSNAEVFVASDPPKMFKLIKQAKHPCLAYKILAAGRLCERRNQIEEAFKTALSNIKSTDAIVVGMYDRHADQAAENANYVRKYSSLSVQV